MIVPEEIGPIDVQTVNGVVDVEVVKGLLGLLSPGPDSAARHHTVPDQTLLRDAIPDNEPEAFDVRPVVETLADEDAVVWLQHGVRPRSW